MWWIVLIAIILVHFLATGRRYRWFYILYKTIPRDIKALIRFTQVNVKIKLWELRKMNVVSIFDEVRQKHPYKVAFYFEDEIWTFQQVYDFSIKVTNFFHDAGYRKGDSVALLMENRPEFVAIWLGLGRIGVVTALINTNLTNDPLRHSLDAANAKAFIYGADYRSAIETVASKLTTIRLFEYRNQKSAPISDDNSADPKLATGQNVCQLGQSLIGVSATLKCDPVEITAREPLLYIYTSGTTGLPKAAVITHQRCYLMAAGLHYMTCLSTDNDILYNSLPLYHSAGGMVGVGQVVLFGVTAVIRKKFSASNFWKDCAKYKCTTAQYIGEICRYLLAVPETNDVHHGVRKMMGNGLKTEIWDQFCTRFNIAEVYEFYGATEGNSNLINTDQRPGAVGFVPRYAELIYPVTLVKCDLISGEPIRDSRGYCARCKIGEPGVFVGKINPKKALNQFTGYADQKATDKKILRGVFKTGDLYFNSGDILVQDELGYFYFRDRTGDTFRWKGENVATSEVEAVLSSVANLGSVVVFGVQIPGTDGRAGMAAIVDPDRKVSLENLALGLRKNLPAYALPLFLRVLKEAPMTGTFKLKKHPLQEIGFDVTKTSDSMYFFDAKLKAYTPLTNELYKDIMSSKMRL